jgi:hypothetical protein
MACWNQQEASGVAMNGRITPITKQASICDDCLLGSDQETDAVVRIEMRTEAHPLYLPKNLCGHHAEIALVPDEPLTESNP